MANLSISQDALKTGGAALDSRWMANADKFLKTRGKTLQMACQEHKMEQRTLQARIPTVLWPEAAGSQF